MAPNKYSYGYQMMQSRKKMVSREGLETARVEASSSAKKPITVPTPRPRMAPGQGWGRPKRLFGGPREERLVRPSQEDIFADSQSPPEDHGTGLTETFNDPPLIGPSTSQASQDSPSSASLPLLPTPNLILAPPRIRVYSFFQMKQFCQTMKKNLQLKTQ